MLTASKWPVGVGVRDAEAEELHGVVIGHDGGCIEIDWGDRVQDYGYGFAGRCLLIATYADLNREPVEGERAVRVKTPTADGYGQPHTFKNGWFYWNRTRLVGWFWQDGVTTNADLFAPLTLIEREHTDDCIYCGDGFPVGQYRHEDGTGPFCSKHCHDGYGRRKTVDLKAHFAECEKGGKHGFASTCDIMWLSWDAPVDPCQPCAVLIDQADYWCSWYAEYADRCHVCGFKTCPSLWEAAQPCPMGGE